MHKCDFLVTFVSCGSGVMSTPEGDRSYYFCNVAGEDGSIDRLSVSREVYDQVKPLVMGDLISVSAELRYLPSDRRWLLKPVAIKTTM